MGFCFIRGGYTRPISYKSKTLWRTTLKNKRQPIILVYMRLLYTRRRIFCIVDGRRTKKAPLKFKTIYIILSLTS